MQAQQTRSYNVAAITRDGRTISTQLWQAQPHEPVDRVREWAYRDLQLTDECPVVVTLMDGSQMPTITTVGAYLGHRPQLYRVVNPLRDNALIMVAPLETIRAVFQPNVAPEDGIGPRIVSETRDGGTCDLHLNNRCPLAGYTQVNVTRAV